MYARQAARAVKEEGLPNPMLDLVCADPDFGADRAALEAVLEPAHYVGRAPAQVEEFLAADIRPLLDAHRDALGMTAQLSV